ncbi:MAG: NADH-quinone oxidoreductase subunit M [Euryarchaeota archaeon]|jgi:NADH-quinone oxidoreductase subunit M|nr:NADH-quinone oxidoreductase subunit M [Euryarchaeota archaeon]MBT6844507.1 NADH-quinone oxidoreductase subunit M [Euryarchaeota archaeon]MBT7262973.1 NADH-quinone oxidoreductase subunit M [Euryarchaeota archaeon]MBT7638366.1 NADH-quinone oxidoreductase subunit M [Euryarchaeota archaeon]
MQDWISMPLVGFPLVASIVLLAFVSNTNESMRKRLSNPIRMASLIFSLLLLAITTGMFFQYFGNVSWEGISFNNYEFTHRYTWIESLGIHWSVGLDALSFPMVWLTTFLLPVTIIATWNEKNGAVYFPILLAMGGALIGVFVALDLFMFYVFWELTLIPMFFLILMWGGKDRKYASQKFFIYTFTASVVMLLGLITLYFFQDSANPLEYAGSMTGRTFDIPTITQHALMENSNGNWYLGANIQKVLFAMLMLGFLVKLPAVPFHTWLPDAHVQAPTGGSMLLAGVMLKMGAYGMFRLPISLFPHALQYFQFVLLAIGMVSLVWGAIVCLGQTNLKKMVAYSSVSHMGVILIGIATMQPMGWAAALFMMFAHGIISPMLFAVCGAFKHHYHSMEIGAMRGMAKHSPWLATSMMFAWMASLGLPLLAGFVAELMMLIALWYFLAAEGLSVFWMVGPALVLAVTAAYYLWSMQRTIFEGGDDTQPPASLGNGPVPDIANPEKLAMIILAFFTIAFGVMPWIALDMMHDWTIQIFEGLVLPILGDFSGGA